jgi:DUF2075 family protein
MNWVQVSGAFYNLKNVKIRIMGTYLGFRIVALIFRNCGNLSKKNRNCGNLSKKSKKNGNYGNISIFKNSELWELILKIGIMGTYLYFDNSELWEHIQSELWHLSFGIMELYSFA